MRLNDCLSRVYNVWLLCVVFRVAHGYITEGSGRSLFEQHLFGHTVMCARPHARTHARTHAHTYIHTYMHVYIHTYMHAYIHIYMHAYIHT